MSINNELLNAPIPKRGRVLPKNLTDQKTTLSSEQESLLKKLYYEDKLFVGRDRLHHYLMQNHPESGISRRDVMKWLQLQKPWQLTKQPPKRASTSLMDIKKQGYMSCDLKGPLPKDRGFEYIFGLVDVASRFQYALPIKSASSIDSRDALKKLIDNNDIEITLLRSDNGSSFKAEFTDFLKERGIKQIYSDPHSPWQNRQERNFKIMGDMLYKNTLATNSKAWVNALPQIVEGMNGTINRSLKTTPAKANDGELPIEVNEERSKDYGVMKKYLSTKSTFKTGDFIRLRLRNKSAFKNKQQYSDDVYIIVKVVHESDSKLVTYKVSKDGDKIEKPSYNITDLLLVNDTKDIEYPELSIEDANVGAMSLKDSREVDELLENTETVSKVRETRKPAADSNGEFEVEAIVGKRKFGKKLKYLVSYVGYDKTYNTWEPIGNLSNAKELINDFREREKQKKKKR